MKKILALIAALLFLCASAALADTEIRVPGRGVVYASADTATISLGVSGLKEDVREAQSSVNTALAAIRQVLEENGISKENISTDIIHVYSEYTYSDTGENIICYHAYSTLAIRTADLSGVGNLIDIAIEAGANSLDGVSFSLSDSSLQQEEALRMALANARRQAEIIAEESGLAIVGVDSIIEQSSYSYNTSMSNYSKAEASVMDSSTATVVQPAKISIEAVVEVIYEAEAR